MHSEKIDLFKIEKKIFIYIFSTTHTKQTLIKHEIFIKRNRC